MAVPGRAAARLYRGDCRLGGDRGGAAALGRLPSAAHHGGGDALIERRRCAGLARAFHPGLFDRVSACPLLPPPDRPRRAGGGRSAPGSCDGRLPAALAGARRGGGRGGAERVSAPLDFVPLWTLIIGFGVFMY